MIKLTHSLNFEHILGVNKALFLLIHIILELINILLLDPLHHLPEPPTLPNQTYHPINRTPTIIRNMHIRQYFHKRINLLIEFYGVNVNVSLAFDELDALAEGGQHLDVGEVFVALGEGGHALVDAGSGC
jgi:hypothetical protein